MPVVTEQGIYTAELCENSKKYLSQLLSGRLLIGAQIKNSNLISWDEILNIGTSEQGEDLINQLYWRLYKNAGYNGPLDKKKLQPLIVKKILKPHIIDKLNTLEYQHHEKEYLKPYLPEFRKQQEDIRCKKLGLISIAIIISLAIAFPFALPLLGGAATLVGVLCLATGATLICCSIIPAFCGERLIDPEWDKEYADIKKESTKKLIAKMMGVSQTSIDIRETGQQVIPPKTIQENEHTSTTLSIASTFSNSYFFKSLTCNPSSITNNKITTSKYSSTATNYPMYL